MFQILTIAKQTLRAHFRSKALLTIIPVLLCVIWILSADTSGDGTLKSMFLVRLEYSITMAVLLCAMITLWLSAFNLSSQEVESHQIQLMLTRPVRSSHIWLGKFLGTMIISATLLALCFCYITWHITNDYKKLKDSYTKDSDRVIAWLFESYPNGKIKDQQIASMANQHAMLYHSINGLKKQFTKDDFKDIDTLGLNKANIFTSLTYALANLQKLAAVKNELLTARIHHDATPSFRLLSAEEVFTKRVAKGLANEKMRANMIPLIRDELNRSEGRIDRGESREWVFTGLDSSQKSNIFLKMRFFYGLDLNSLSKTGNININISMWEPKKKLWSDPYLWQGRGARYYHLPIRPDFISDDGEAKIKITNAEGGKGSTNAVLIRKGEGPFLVMGQYSFIASMTQTFFLYTGLLATFTAVGCTFGFLFSSSMAILLAGTYFILGSILNSFISNTLPQNFMEQIIYYFHIALAKIIAGFGDFHSGEYLARGQILSYFEAFKIMFIEVVLKVSALLILTVQCIKRKEFGKVVRK
ncbi:hypothetical protein PQO03_02260 [Lentisphaera profundi]|uniref:ABC transporter permease n=1 Tax=Lentisphaera profundi TaxID=1658616 RepID=A0ABY7VRF0_9BACT|nr:hypothetical protein [Lentisphaera profundi]WDE96783.1 hypothetical protein PQO03_02260 [Lentisphaera profundi]